MGTNHDVRFNDGVINKKICMVGSGFAKGSPMLWKGDKKDGTPWIVKSYPQYAVAVPKGDSHIWYRATFQFKLNTGAYYSGYWEMDIHFRKKNEQMPAPYVVKFWDETWNSDAFGWHFYEREEVEQTTYDAISEKAAPQPKPAPKEPTPPPPKEPTPPAPEPEPVAEAAPEPVAEVAEVAEVADVPEEAVLVEEGELPSGTSSQSFADLIFQPPKVGPVELGEDDLIAVYEPTTQSVQAVTRKEFIQMQ